MFVITLFKQVVYLKGNLDLVSMKQLYMSLAEKFFAIIV